MSKQPDSFTKLVLVGTVVVNVGMICLAMRTGPPPKVEIEARRAAEQPTTEGDGVERLWGAICQVESGGRANAVGDGGDSVGAAQISTIMVRDCNRIVGWQRWTNQDRLSPRRSREMFDVYMGHYVPNGTNETKSRCWVAGPDGYRQACSLAYWRKVRSALGENVGGWE